jgi:hypothetical protein
MEKKLYLVAGLLALLAFAALSPVFALPVEKVPFTGVVTGYKPQPPQGEDYRKTTTDGDTIHIINQIGAGTVKLWLGTTATTGTPTYEGTWTTTFKMNINLKTGGIGPVQYKMIWTFSSGTFEGNILGTMVAPTPTSLGLINLHGVLQGTGIFNDQKITIEDGQRALSGGPTTYIGTFS